MVSKSNTICHHDLQLYLQGLSLPQLVLALRSVACRLNRLDVLIALKEFTCVPLSPNRWTNLALVGRVESPRPRLLVHDIKLLLLRFALEDSFSTDSRGGGRESNMKLLLYLVQMANYLLDKRTAPQRRTYHRTLSAYVAACAGDEIDGTNEDSGTVARNPSGLGDSVATPVAVLSSTSPLPERAATNAESPLYMLVLSLLLHSSCEWRAARIPMLRRAAAYWRAAGSSRERFPLAGSASPSASPVLRPSRSPRPSGERHSGSASVPLPLDSPAVDAASSGSASASASATQAPSCERVAPGSSGGAPFSDVRPVLLFFALIDRVQSFFKPESAKSADGADADGWVAVMHERLRKQDQSLLGQLTQLVREYEEELLPAESASEIFDILGVLPVDAAIL